MAGQGCLHSTTFYFIYSSAVRGKEIIKSKYVASINEQQKKHNRINFKQEKNQKYERFCEEEVKLRSPSPGRRKKEKNYKSIA